jgi:hypothetical protein
MIKCPKCQNQLSARFMWRADGICQTCHASLKGENLNVLGFIAILLAGIIAALVMEAFEAAGYPLVRFWYCVLIFSMMQVTNVLLRAFFLRVKVIAPPGKSLNL